MEASPAGAGAGAYPGHNHGRLRTERCWQWKCGGGNTGFSTDVYDNQVHVTADPKGALKWDQTTYQAQAGNVTFVVTNTSPTIHNFAVMGNGVNAISKNFRGQNAQMLSLPNLAPGEYMIVCTVPGHREAGMVAKLIVK